MVVRPEAGNSWEYMLHEGAGDFRTLEKVKIIRTNLPLAPEKVRTVQTAQGISMDAGIMMLDKGRPHAKGGGK